MKSIWVAHPTGNVFVRALLESLNAEHWDYHFFSTLAFSAGASWLKLLPQRARSELSRRTYQLPADRVTARPALESVRLISERFGRKAGIVVSVDSVYESLDRYVARTLEGGSARPQTVYAYEDGALATFEAAARHEVQCVYDLPILYFEAARKILEAEADRLPEWEPTLGATRDSTEKLDRKVRELELANVVVCPSQAVFSSLPPAARDQKRCIVSQFGSPAPVDRPKERSSKLRVLFAGQMSQRKGLADVFTAMKKLRRKDVELIVLGAPVLPLAFYRSMLPDFTHEPPRNHKAVLELMASCDVLVLPSLVEGRALVQQEALACGLPLIVTENAGGGDLIEPGETGFLVPIRSPDSIAERIDWFATHRDELEHMREKCRKKAAAYTWQDYSARILNAVSNNDLAVSHL